MTIVVVDPADIREDAEAALLGLERMRGKRLDKVADEIFNSSENRKFWFLIRPKSPYVHTRRQIGKAVAEYFAPGMTSDESYAILNTFSGSCATMGYHGWDHGQAQPIRDLIEAAKSVNAQELHVNSHTLKVFEEAYELGSKPFDPEA